MEDDYNDEVIDLNGDVIGLLDGLREAFNALGPGATYSLDDGRFLTGIEIHHDEGRIVFLTD